MGVDNDNSNSNNNSNNNSSHRGFSHSSNITNKKNSDCNDVPRAAAPSPSRSSSSFLSTIMDTFFPVTNEKNKDKDNTKVDDKNTDDNDTDNDNDDDDGGDGDGDGDDDDDGSTGDA